MDYKNLIEFQLWGNTGQEYLFAAGVFIVSIIVLKIFQVIILKKLQSAAEHTKTDLDDILVSIVEKLKPPFYSFIAFYIALKILNLSNLIENIIDGLFILVLVYQIINALQEFIIYITNKLSSKEGGSVNRSIADSISMIAKITLWTFAILLILSNWGVNITSLVAGLGIGGIAIALALQKILGDIFSSFSIFIDKPFEPGDFIVAGADMGEVKKIGIKTTRIKTLQGEELIISNQELTTQRIKNFKKMKERRILFTLGVCYETPIEKMRKIPDIIREIINKEDNTKIDRVYFKSYGDFSLNYEIVYYVSSGEYIKYAEAQESINFAIKEAFEKEKIEFAYPTQTVFVKNDIINP